MKLLRPILFFIYIILLVISIPFSYVGRFFIIISLFLKGDFYTLKRFVNSKQNDKII